MSDPVHKVCAYLRSTEENFTGCRNCPARVETSAGPGMPGCYAIAQETISVCMEAMGQIVAWPSQANPLPEPK